MGGKVRPIAHESRGSNAALCCEWQQDWKQNRLSPTDDSAIGKYEPKYDLYTYNKPNPYS